MKRILLFVVFVTAMVVWLTPSFAHTTYNVSDSTMAASSLDGVNLNFGLATDHLNIGSVVSDTVNIFTGNSDYTQVAVTTNGNAKGVLVFKGSSTVYGGIGASGTALYGITANDGTTLNFLGTVFLSTGHLDVGSGTVNFKSGAAIVNNTLATNFLASAGTTGKISLDTNTIVIGALTTATDNQGTLALASGSILDGAVGDASTVHGLQSINVVGSGVSARITGAVDAYSFDLGSNTLNIGPAGGAATGALTIGAAGVINTTITSDTVYGNIKPQGASSLGTTITVNVTVPSGAYLSLNKLFDIVQASSSLTNATVVTVVVTPSSNPLYKFEPVPLNGTTGAVVTIKTTGTPIKPANPVANPVADVVGNALLTLPSTSPLVVAINALTTAGAVANAEAQLAPSTPSLAAPLVTYQGIREFQNLWLAHLDACGQVSWPSEDKENCKGKDAVSGWWLKGFGYWGSQNARGAFTAYDSRIIGTMLAYDRSLGLNTRGGLGFGYAQSTIKGKVFDANTDSDTYQAVAYIGHESGPWFVDGSASFGWNEYQDRRHVEFTGVDTTAKAKYNGQDYTAFGRTGFRIPVQQFTITPMASLQYSRVNIDGYTEKEAGSDVDMVVRSQHYDYLESGLGAKVERDFIWRRLTFVPEGHFEWLHKLSNPKLGQTAAYFAGSESFTTPGLRTVADSYHAGVGLTLLSCSCSATTWSLEGGYDYYWRTDGYAANQVTMRLTNRF